MSSSTYFFTKAPLGRFHVRFKGVWDMDELYKRMAEWFKKRKYKFYEKVYKHKAPTEFGKERQYVWTAERLEDDYHKFVIDVYMHTYDAEDFEVKMPDGTSQILTKGRIWIEFDGHVLFDYEKKWEQSKFYAELRNFYNKYIIKKKIEHTLWDQLWYREVHKLNELVTNILNMYTKEHEHRNWMGPHL